jgi:hypothetical protein
MITSKLGLFGSGNQLIKNGLLRLDWIIDPLQVFVVNEFGK